MSLKAFAARRFARRRERTESPCRKGRWQASEPAMRQRKSTSLCIKSWCFIWCGRRDLNPYPVTDTPLKRTRMPIPPRPQSMIIIANPGGVVKGSARAICSFRQGSGDTPVSRSPPPDSSFFIAVHSSRPPFVRRAHRVNCFSVSRSRHRFRRERKKSQTGRRGNRMTAFGVLKERGLSPRRPAAAVSALQRRSAIAMRNGLDAGKEGNQRGEADES